MYTIELNTEADFSGYFYRRSGNYNSAVNFSGTLAYETTYYTRVKTDITPGIWGTTTQFETGAAQQVSFDKRITTVGLASDGISPASFGTPKDIAIDASGNIYVVENAYNRIRKISPSGIVTTLAGGGQVGYDDVENKFILYDGQGETAAFNSPDEIDVDAFGNVYVADFEHHIIRKITPSGMVSTVAGAIYEANSTVGPVTSARFIYPWGVKVDQTGNLFVTDRRLVALKKLALQASLLGFSGGGVFVPEHGYMVDHIGYDIDARGLYLYDK